jgi:5-methylcytosine-specific restriction enzyme B
VTDQSGAYPELSDEPVRRLNVEDLGVEDSTGPVELSPGQTDAPAPAESDELLADDDPFYSTTLELLERYGGVIFEGPPGTSKTYYAARIAQKLAGGDSRRVRFVQFHPSYQYEDFVQGFVPDEGGFYLRPKHLLEMCELAEGRPGEWVVLVIDELSRGDPGRVFGEALTYVEKSKRGLSFSLASGNMCVIPENLAFLATMNPLDRGVDEVDAAFERRFAKIAMEPDEQLLASILAEAGMPAGLAERVRDFFRMVNSMAGLNPLAAIGHTFFVDMRDESDLRRLWEHQLRFLFRKAYRLDPDGYAEVERAWARLFRSAADDQRVDAPSGDGDPTKLERPAE